MELIPGLIDDVGRECLLRIPYEAFPSSTAASSSWAAEIQLPEFYRRRQSSGLTRPVLVLSQAQFDPSGGSPPGSDKTPSVGRPCYSYSLVLCEPGSGIWRPMTPVPGSSGRLPMFCRLVGVGTDLVLLGGWDPETCKVSSAVHVFSFLTGLWRRGPDMPGVGRSLFGCAADQVKRQVLVAGGHDVDKNALRSAMIYDVDRDQWAFLPDMARERDECCALVRRGRFHVISGYSTDTQGRFDQSLEVFDLPSRRWDEVNECEFLASSSSRDDDLQAACSVAAGDNGEVLYMCRDRNLVVYSGDKQPRTAAEVPVPAEVGSSPYVMTWRDKVMVVGSLRHGESHECCCYVLDLKSFKWEHLDMPSEHCGHVQSGCLFEL